MKKFLCSLLFLVVVFVACSTVADSIRTPPLEITVNAQEEKGAKSENQVQTYQKEGLGTKEGVDMEMYPTGSKLPDCSYACGPCSPCKRVMISFRCSVAESCSVIYRCTCKGRYYHVPSRA